MDKPFVTEHIYNAPIHKVWQALTSEDSLKTWYFPQLKKFDPIVGFRFEFTDDGSAYQKEWQVTKVEDGHKLAHSWAYKDYPGSSEVVFTLLEAGNKTILRLTHTGIGSFPDDPHFARHRFEDGWQNLLGHNLKNYLYRN